ncbi:MAG: hypothetical protein AAFQ36_09010 [Pseudomonadota bacterium]
MDMHPQTSPLQLVSVVVLLALGGGQAAAQSGNLLLEGRDYLTTYNQHGLILSPANGAPGVIYLGIGCDVFSPSRGTGRWSAREGQVYIEFTTGESLPFEGSLRSDMSARCPL